MLTTNKKSMESSMTKTASQYSEVATMHGIYYIFEKKFGYVSRSFWFLVSAFLFSLGVYMILNAYTSWQNNPVLTTVETTGYPIRDLAFPSVTICGLGLVESAIFESLYKQVQAYAKLKKGVNYVDVDTEMAYDVLEANQISVEEFVDDMYPGLDLSFAIDDLIPALASPNPNAFLYSSFVSARIAQDEKNCTNTNTTAACPLGYVFDNEYEICYGINSKIGHEFLDIGGCNPDKDEDILAFYEDEQVDAFIHKIETDESLKDIKNGEIMWYSAYRDEITEIFYFGDGTIDPSNPVSPFTNLTFHGSFSQQGNKCVTLQYDNQTSSLLARNVNCEGIKVLPICMQSVDECFSENEDSEEGEDFSGSGSGSGSESGSGSDGNSEEFRIDFILNPKRKFKLSKELFNVKKQYNDIFKNIDMKKSFGNLFEILWYSQLPCFDTLHTNSSSSRAMLKKCSWKGQSMSCAAIFDTFPTDRGMCCTFNMAKANEIFQKSEYQQMIHEMQERDKNVSKYGTKPPDSYIKNKEPIPQPGINKGLSLILDAHTNLLAPGSVGEDFQGFLAIIGSSNQYPLFEQKNIRIRSGYDNLIGITATTVIADKSIEKIESNLRNCLFENELKLEFHQKYSQANCFLECQMEYASNETSKDDILCTPWFLPKSDQAGKGVCNPWEALNFTTLMREVPDASCQHCLPDCNVTNYQTTVTALPFRRCDEKNLGVSFFCNLNSADVPDPPIFGQQVKNEYLKDPNHGSVPKYVNTNSNLRKLTSTENPIFKHLSEQTYDAYAEDIASVKIYFEASSVFQYSRRARMSTLDFLSQIGGLLGLCIGFSICSGVEIAYWFTIRLWANYKLSGKDNRRSSNKKEKSKWANTSHELF